MTTVSELERYRGHLAIDQDDLDKCLMEQPEVYYVVAQAVANTTAERDKLKLELEELQAKLGLDLRDQATRRNEKLTEGGLEQKLAGMPKIQELQRSLLTKRQEAESWGVLKEAFQQRSFMLRELVALFIAQRHDLALEGGAGQARATLAANAAAANQAAAGALRRSRRGV